MAKRRKRRRKKEGHPLRKCCCPSPAKTNFATPRSGFRSSWTNRGGKRRTFILPDKEYEAILAKQLYDRKKIIAKESGSRTLMRLVEPRCLEGPCRTVFTRIGSIRHNAGSISISADTACGSEILPRTAGPSTTAVRSCSIVRPTSQRCRPRNEEVS